MIKSIKVMLHPNNKQNTKLFQYAGASRFAYNWALGRQIENFKAGNKFINDGDLRKEFTKLKEEEKYKWLKNISNNVTKQAIKDCCNAYKRFFDIQKKTGEKFTKKKLKSLAKKNKQPTTYEMNGHPKFKTKKHSTPKFYQDVGNIKFTETHVKFESFSSSRRKNKQKLNWVRLAEKNRIPFGENVKYGNPRITFDGINWWISVAIEFDEPSIDIEKTTNDNEGVGIDVGIKDLAICSDGEVYKNINKTKKVRKLEKKRRRLQRRISRKYQKNKEGVRYCKTCNLTKSEKELRKLCHRLTNIRHDYMHKSTSEIINRKPMFVVLEDLNVKGMMSNKHLAKAVQEQRFYEFKMQIEYKCNWNNIKFVEAPRFFPSSKSCNKCGHINKNLKLSDRVYKCDCGYVEDRDLNAALNLRDYGKSVV